MDFKKYKLAVSALCLCQLFPARRVRRRLMILLQRPYALAQAFSAELHRAPAIMPVRYVDGSLQLVPAGVNFLIRHREQVALHLAAFKQVKEYHARLAVGHAWLEHGLFSGKGGFYELRRIAGGAAEGDLARVADEGLVKISRASYN